MVVVQDAVGAQQLARQPRDLQRVVDVVALGHGDVHIRGFFLVLKPAELQTQQLSFGDFGHHVDQFFLYQLVRSNGLVVELNAPLGVVQRLLVAGHGRPHGAPGNAVARLGQTHERVLQTGGLRQEVLRRNAAVVEQQLGRVGGPQGKLAVDGFGREARRAFLHQKAPDARFGLGPHHGHVRQGAVGNPHLAAVEDPAVARAFGAGAHGRRIGAGVRFGQSEATDRLAAGQLRQPGLLLFLGTEGVNRVHDQAALHGNETANAAVRALQFLIDQPVSHVVEPGAAVALQVRAHQAQLAEFRNELHREGPLAVVLANDRHHLLLHKFAHGGTGQTFFVGQQVVDQVKVGALKFCHVGFLIPQTG